MKTLLHILTRPEDELARTLIALEQSADNKTVVIDLTQPQPDYKKLLLEVFAADSIQTW